MLGLLTAMAVVLTTLTITDGRGPSVGLLFNADALYLPSLERDVSAGGAVSRWFLTPAPYFFPDMLLFWPVGLLTSSAVQAQHAYAVVQVVLFAALVAGVGGLVGGRRAGVFSFALVAALLAPVVAAGADVFAYVGVSGYHAGALLASIGGLALLGLCPLAADTSGQGRRGAALLASLSVLTAASTLSDPIFLIQFSGPAIAGLLLLTLTGAVRWTWLGYTAAAIVLGHLVGTRLYPRVVTFDVRTAYDVSFGLDQVDANSSYLRQLIGEVYAISPWAVVLLVLGLSSAVLALLTIALWWRRLPVRAAWLAALWCLWTVTSSAALLASFLTLESRPPAARYLVGLALTSTGTLAIVLAVLLCVAVRSATVPVLVVSGTMLVSGAAVLTTSPTVASPFSVEALEAKVTCIERAVAGAPAPHGLAWYWHSKQVYALSDSGIVTASAGQDLAPAFLVASSDWFEPPFGFVLTRQDAAPEVQALTAQGATVRTRVDCADAAVLVLAEPFIPAGWRTRP